MRAILVHVLILFIALNESTAQPNVEDEIIYTFFLIGDTGKPLYEKAKANLDVLERQLQQAKESSGVIFLGDNIYPLGVPNKDADYYKEAKKYLDVQLQRLSDYPGDIFFIAGNHDWAKGRSYGWQQVMRQEAAVDSFFTNRENVFFPDNGCPGPVEISLNKEITLVLIDTQWLLQRGQKPMSDCDIESVEEIFMQIEDILSKNMNKKVIVAAHHPLVTYGSHGGYYNLRQHIFPLTDVVDWLYLPLPGLGSIYPLYRKYFGNIQDLAHPEYKAIVAQLTTYFKDYPNTIYIAGHEHSLQYNLKDSTHHIVSGAGSKTSYVKNGKYARFVSKGTGFSKLLFYKNGNVVLQTWEPGENAEGQLVFQDTIFKKPFRKELTSEYYDQNIDFRDSTVIVRGSEQYKASGFGKFMLGKNYRDVWNMPIEVQVFDIGKEKGGLKIIKKGGGQSTISLRLEAEDGKQYVLRSIDKNPEKALPKEIRETFAAELVQDQISANHPYGAFIIPAMAQAVGIYHTNPRLVYIPDDPRLGKYRSEFANMLALFEQRPDDDYWEDAENFGYSEEIYSYSKMLKELRDDNDNEIDEHFVLRNRLFDLVIGDWDRHDDQWRWASFEKKGEKGLLFRPIPRDRDQAFFINEGFIPKIVSRRWAMPKLEGFNPEVRWVEGFNFNGRYFDRTYLTELKKSDWLAMADTIQQRLSDEVIDQALQAWPKKIYELDAAAINQKIKSRRDQLSQYALDYYLFLAEKVNILGSDKHERFEVKRLNDEETLVTVYKTKKEGNVVKKIYERTFYHGETREIRLYGLEGRDQFYIEGEVDKGIKVRVIGGEDEDIIVDQSRVRGWGKKTIVYDRRNEENQLNLGPETKNRVSNHADVNLYNRLEFKYNMVIPLITGNFNNDDGLFIGGGALITTHGFRKEPFATRNLLLTQYAPRTQSWNTSYRGDFTRALGRFDLQVNANLRIPSYVTNYFGLGNETINLASDLNNQEKDIDFYRTRFELIEVNALLKQQLNPAHQFLIGPMYQSFQLQDVGGDKFIYDFPENDLPLEGTFQEERFAGLQISYELDRRNQKALPSRGLYWRTDAQLMKRLTNTGGDVATLRSELAFYYSFRLPSRLVFATRFGGGINFGDYEFFQASVLDGVENMRGYRKTRFWGRNSFYNNFEARLMLFRFKTYIFPGSLGLLAFNDVGRVWVDDESSDQWHHGYGGGIWLSPLDQAVVSFMLGFSEEESFLPLLKFNFLF